MSTTTSNPTSTRHFMAIKGQVYERLAAKGTFGESASDLISRLLDLIENKENRKKSSSNQSMADNLNLETKSDDARTPNNE